MQGRKVRLNTLRLPDPALWGRRELSRDAIERYKQLFENSKTRAIAVQAGTGLIIDGVHRYHAAAELGLEDLWAVEHEIADQEVRGLAFKLNSSHGVPYSRDERNEIIRHLYFTDGKTQAQIGEITGLSQQAISYILSVAATKAGNGDAVIMDKRTRLRDDQMPAVARLLLKGTTHEEVAGQFGVARSTVTERWNIFRDEVKTAYEGGLLKKEVAEKVKLTTDEVDAILRQYDPEPLNFTPASGSLWIGFKIDDRFGLRHPGNLPAELVRNLLHYYTRARDVILDPFCGGGVVLDVAADMVGRAAYGFDIDPRRDDIQKWDITAGPPPCAQEPTVIFLDPPYGPMKAGEYSAHPHELANMSVGEFLDVMAKVFTYWDKGRIILVMGCLRKEGEFTALPYECAKRLEAAGWVIVDWLVNQVNRPASETGIAVSMERKHRVPMRTHVDVIVAERGM